MDLEAPSSPVDTESSQRLDHPFASSAPDQNTPLLLLLRGVQMNQDDEGKRSTKTIKAATTNATTTSEPVDLSRDQQQSSCDWNYVYEEVV